MELPVGGRVLYKHIVILHNNDHEAKVYQCNLFEKARVTTNTRARMKRGDKRGDIRDIWKYDNHGKLINWTTYESVKVRGRGDANRINSDTCNGYIFLTDCLDSDTLSTLFSKLRKVEGVIKSIEEINDPEIKHEQY